MSIPEGTWGAGMGPEAFTMPTTPPVAEATVVENGRHFMRSRKTLAGVVALAAVTAGAIGLEVRHNNVDSVKAHDPVAALAEGENSVEVCPDGMFPNGPYEATIKAFGQNELTQRPSEKLTDNKSLLTYLFSKDQPDHVAGVSCRSTLSLAALSGTAADLFGAGGSETFSNTDMNGLAQTYINDPKKAESDAHILEKLYANGQDNKETLGGTWFRIGAEPTGDDKNPDKVVLIPAAVDVAPGQAIVFDYASMINDGDASKADKDQKLFFDKATGQMYVLKAFGAEIKQPQAADQKDQNNDKGGGSADRQSTGGGNNSNEHNGKNNGCTGGCGEGGQSAGSGSGSGNGGGGAGGGCGGGCGGSGGGETPTTSPNTTTPPKTVPPTTTPNTVPPTTTPNTTVPTTTPTTTPNTTLPKGSDPGEGGAPN